jgi:mRNA interferase MazF
MPNETQPFTMRSHSLQPNSLTLRIKLGYQKKIGRLGKSEMRRGEIWFAETERGGDRPVLVLTRDPVAARIGAVVVAQLTTHIRGLKSELRLDPILDGVPSECVVSFDNLATLPRSSFRSYVTTLSEGRMHLACASLNAALGCSAN